MSAPCPSLDDCEPCGTLPAGFVRLRYFYGKRLGVSDFVDEQRYHTGKARFHNQHLHGAGVLCGLAVTFEQPGVLLRVSRGAAIDGCGREVVVGHDQCLALGDWYTRVRQERRGAWPTPILDADQRLPICVVVRYRECSTSPEPAPRDPCAFDASGCDLGRVREDFELDVVVGTAAEHTAPSPYGAIGRALRQDRTATALGAAIDAALASGCPAGDGEAWLPLATMTLELDALRARVIAVHDLTAAGGHLHATAVTQELLRRQLAAQLEAGALLDGPEVVGLTLTRNGADHELALPLSAPVHPDSVPAKAFALHRFEPTAAPRGWRSVGVGATRFVPATATSPDQLVVTVVGGGGEFPLDRGAYRLALDPEHVRHTTPIVDAQLRPLRPLRPAIQFSIRERSPGAFELTEAPYAS